MELNFAQRLKELREASELSQRKIGELLNLKGSAVTKYEKEQTQPSLATIIKIAEIFEVSVDYLLGISNIRNPYPKQLFTQKELEIIGKYRKLTQANKVRVDERMNTLLDGQKP